MNHIRGNLEFSIPSHLIFKLEWSTFFSIKPYGFIVLAFEA